MRISTCISALSAYAHIYFHFRLISMWFHADKCIWANIFLIRIVYLDQYIDCITAYMRFFHKCKYPLKPQISSAQRVGFFSIGSGRVLYKILGAGSGSGRVRVSKNTIGYFRVSFFFRVFPGISGISGIFRYFWVYPYILG